MTSVPQNDADSAGILDLLCRSTVGRRIFPYRHTCVAKPLSAIRRFTADVYQSWRVKWLLLKPDEYLSIRDNHPAVGLLILLDHIESESLVKGQRHVHVSDRN